MDYRLTAEEELEFNLLVATYKDKIKLALYKCNIAYRQYDEFYSNALEGLLVSFLILKKGDIAEKDFDKFALATMKRKIIDELRRRSRYKLSCFEEVDNTKVFAISDNNLASIEIENSIKSVLTAEEYKIYILLKQGLDSKIIFSKLNISKSKGYELIASIKSKYKSLLYNF
ncbi:sigma-70 family RNA polymerase sigma factor [Gemella sp. zg-1178]|uniref:sigma-70 family RNA polymerase sigma factor n=1 Tax=Gemella sp. zg-1178 TaxID=2840372 RepID=UPI001C04FEFE|nr:sigma-70 family RNA polymerase sigma factor [Gemella sp. zg-1178]MBU0279314.1 sigma-70 family RNA polymerase sigma factor [Gemella sp. zg-1178]